MNKKIISQPKNAKFYEENLVKTHPSFQSPRLTIEQIINIGVDNSYTPSDMVDKFNLHKKNFNYDKDFFQLLKEWYDNTAVADTQKAQLFLSFIHFINNNEKDRRQVVNFLNVINDINILQRIQNLLLNRFKSYTSSLGIINHLNNSISNRLNDIKPPNLISPHMLAADNDLWHLKKYYKRKETRDEQSIIGEDKKNLNDIRSPQFIDDILPVMPNNTLSNSFLFAANSSQSGFSHLSAQKPPENFPAFENLNIDNLLNEFDENSIMNYYLYNNSLFTSFDSDNTEAEHEQDHKQNLRKIMK